MDSVTQHVDLDVATRYAKVSNDWSDHHFDLASARNAGVDYLFAHGLCIMAMCTQAAVGLVAGGDPSRVRRVAVRFASPTRLDADLTVDVYDAGDGVYAFEASCADAAVIKHGRLELFSWSAPSAVLSQVASLNRVERGQVTQPRCGRRDAGGRAAVVRSCA